MRHPKPLPRSLVIAMIAGQFRQDRFELMQAARSESSREPHFILDHVREARACNWSMIHRIKAARAAHRRELRGTSRAVNLRVLDHQAEVIRLLKDKVDEYEEKMRRMSLNLEDGNRYDRKPPKL